MANDIASDSPAASSFVVSAIAWLAVGIPLFWGVEQTLRKALLLFH